MAMESDVAVLWQQYVQTRRKQLRDALIMAYIPLVQRIANKMITWLPASVDPQDVYSYGIVGLISAIEKFKPSLGVKFESFATWRIKGEILDYLRSQDLLPKQQRMRLKQMQETYELIEQETGRPASEAEVAERLGCSIEEVWELLRLNNLAYSLSLDAPIAEDLYLKDTVTQSSDVVGKVNKKLIIERIEDIVGSMDEKTQQVLNLYFVEDLRLKEIGEVLGISESRVSQILSKALFELRQRLNREGINV